MNLRRQMLASAAAALLLLYGGLTEATAVVPQPTSPTAVAPAVDADADDDDASSPTNPTLATGSTSGFSAALAPNFDECRYAGYSIGSTCFQWVGDNQWVVDNDANGWAAVAHVQTNYDKNRYCQARPSAEGWDYCDFDHKEGKCVRFRMYELKDGVTRNWTAWSPWYGIDYGWPC